MPTYEYRCDACGSRFEKFQKMSEDPVELCPECGEPEAERLISSGAGLVFKGSGFYETDYKKAGDEEPGGEGDSSDGEGEGPGSEATGGGGGASGDPGNGAERES